jgi:hypothetical protein
MEFVIIFMVVGMIVGVIAVFLIGKFFLDTIPHLDEILWEDLEWDEPDEDAKLRPLLGVVHPNKNNLL